MKQWTGIMKQWTDNNIVGKHGRCQARQQLRWCQARQRRPGSRVRDSGVGVKGRQHWAWWRMVTRRSGAGGVGCHREAEWRDGAGCWAAARGGAASSFRHRGAGRKVWRQALGMDKRGSGDNNGGSPVMVTTNFGSLTTYYVKSNAL
jgi:hypothetical protein